MKLSIIKNKIALLLVVITFLSVAGFCLAHLPRIVYTQKNDVQILNPENSQAFYDELSGVPRNYLINSKSEFTLYVNLLVPFSNYYARYSANVYKINNDKEELIKFIDGETNFAWQEFYEPFDRDYYLKGPELEKTLPAGQYKIQVFNSNSPTQLANTGKYVLAVGKKEVFPILDSLGVYWILPTLKIQFLKTPVYEFILTPFGIMAGIVLIVILFFIAFLFFAGGIIDKIKKIKPQMLLLTSSGMEGSQQDILAVLTKPADAVRVAHIITASKPENDKFYMENDERLMKEAGFNVEQIDIEGKNKTQLLKILENFDIIYMQGGNNVYLLKQIKASGFDKIIKKLLRKGIIYIGVSAGSIVAGKSGMKLIPYNVFVHYTNEFTELIKSKSKREKRKLKILTDGEALFVYGRKITLVGNGTAINPNNL